MSEGERDWQHHFTRSEFLLQMALLGTLFSWATPLALAMLQGIPLSSSTFLYQFETFLLKPGNFELYFYQPLPLIAFALLYTISPPFSLIFPTLSKALRHRLVKRFGFFLGFLALAQIIGFSFVGIGAVLMQLAQADDPANLLEHSALYMMLLICSLCLIFLPRIFSRLQEKLKNY